MTIVAGHRIQSAENNLGPLDEANPALLVGPLPRVAPEQMAYVIAARFLAGYSGYTRKAYLQDLRDYFAWCERHDVEVLEAGRSTIDFYARGLAEPSADLYSGRLKPLGRATIARRLVTLSGYYRYAVSEDVTTRSPVDHVRRPKVAEDSPTLGLDRREAGQLLAAAAEHSPRARALLTLLLHDGLRISEALSADVTDLTTVHGHRVLQITRKGGARRHVVLNAAVCDALDTYLAERPIDPAEGPLFNTRTGGRFVPSEAWRLVRKVATAAGIEHADRLSPHSLRHTFVTLSREAGVPLEDVQDAAGHADPRTTRRYDRGRHNLDRSPAHLLGSYLAAAGTTS